MTASGGPTGLDPDWVPEPVRREPADPAVLPAFGSRGMTVGALAGRADTRGAPGRPWLTGWQVGGLAAAVLVPFLAWFLWSALQVEQEVPAEDVAASATPSAWPWPGGVVPAPPQPSATSPLRPTPSVTLLPPPPTLVPGRRPTPAPIRPGPGQQTVPPAVQFPPNLRPTAVPGGARPSAVPTAPTRIRLEVSGPTSRPYTVYLAGSGTGSRRTFQGQTGTVALDVPPTVLTPTPGMPVPMLGATVQTTRLSDTVTCRILVGGVTVAYQQGRGHATCTVTSAGLGWK
ncbi:hypothetical protein N864_23750 [Intrasporangium chromatireducens Q5-1]|uniref:Uncharacterized protein n=1 Tax=Intrasporangium chromatireducens Q5-1 TaxID=584657 RepID=W9GJB3_9MICO|nr:hypothetical protein [Intrasporangium chromatireducens]EWT06175.1 hypothetical protein N864_23750 [Intrasporangium chromatireducens Q5-1]